MIGEGQYFDGWVSLLNFGGQLIAGAAGHLNVQQEHMGQGLGQAIHQIEAIGVAAGDEHLRVAIQYVVQAFYNQWVIVGNGNFYFHGVVGFGVC